MLESFGMQDAILLQFHNQLAVEASYAGYARCTSPLLYEVHYLHCGWDLACIWFLVGSSSTLCTL